MIYGAGCLLFFRTVICLLLRQLTDGEVGAINMRRVFSESHLGFLSLLRWKSEKQLKQGGSAQARAELTASWPIRGEFS